MLLFRFLIAPTKIICFLFLQIAKCRNYKGVFWRTTVGHDKKRWASKVERLSSYLRNRDSGWRFKTSITFAKLILFFFKVLSSHCLEPKWTSLPCVNRLFWSWTWVIIWRAHVESSLMENCTENPCDACRTFRESCRAVALRKTRFKLHFKQTTGLR